MGVVFVWMWDGGDILVWSSCGCGMLGDSGCGVRVDVGVR